LHNDITFAKFLIAAGCVLCVVRVRAMLVVDISLNLIAVIGHVNDLSTSVVRLLIRVKRSECSSSVGLRIVVSIFQARGLHSKN